VVNVLQSMILTEGEKMVVTPSYHVFEMYKVHQDATRLPVEIKSPPYAVGEQSMPALSVSASRKDGRVHVSIVNVHATAAVELSCELPGVVARSVSGRLLTAAELDAHNTFTAPDRLQPRAIDGAEHQDGKLRAIVPARSGVVLAVEP
jgi:alpha-N-arabinofuranosidase